MNRLPGDFTYTEFGVQLRLADVDDAEFILKLRTDPKLTRFIHDTENDIQKQKTWLGKYKERERLGQEYYFIASVDTVPYGVIRIYNIHEKTFTIGSILIRAGAPVHCALAVTIITKEIAFEILNLELEDTFDGVHVDNKQVVKFSRSWGKQEYRRFQDVKGEYIAFRLTKEDYLKVKPQKLRQLELIMG